MQVLTIITLSTTFIGMAGSIMGQNLYFSSHETPLVSRWASGQCL